MRRGRGREMNEMNAARWKWIPWRAFERKAMEETDGGWRAPHSGESPAELAGAGVRTSNVSVF